MDVKKERKRFAKKFLKKSNLFFGIFPMYANGKTGRRNDEK